MVVNNVGSKEDIADFTKFAFATAASKPQVYRDRLIDVLKKAIETSKSDMELVQELVGRGNFSMLAAFMLGLLAALSPCPLATNITAIGYVGKDFNSPRRVFISGIVYASGRILAYSFLGGILVFY